MNRLPKRSIANSYLPHRYHYGYVLCKLATDPLYEGVCAELAQHREPILDLGCGLGILAHCLRASGNEASYVGVDADHEKIGAATVSAQRRQLRSVAFRTMDLEQDMPAHRGTVLMLDLLQYLNDETRTRLLRAAADALSPDGMLLMRIGIDDGSWRAALTRSADRFGHRLRWMRTAFRSQPTAQQLQAAFEQLGLNATMRPLWGHTPFNNYLVVATRIR